MIVSPHFQSSGPFFVFSDTLLQEGQRERERERERMDADTLAASQATSNDRVSYRPWVVGLMSGSPRKL